MTSAHFDFATRPLHVTIDWPRRVAAHLDALPPHGWTPLQDWALVEHFSGQDPRKLAHVEGYLGTGHALRLRHLLSATVSDNGAFSLDGREALLKALRERAGQ